ncbi:MAG: sugar transferase [bacterium]
MGIVQESEYVGKRLLDLFFSVILLVLSVPLFLLIAIAIKLESKGPVFYRHLRVGKFGRNFRMWKFRTMVQGADKMGSGLTQYSDPRITKVGKFLRRFSFDELPQIINVVVGDMSLIGPRPEIFEIVNLYTAQQREALNVRPGITGLTQINGRDNLPLDAKLEIEREYVHNNSLWLDLKILWLTFPAVWSGEGARY